MAATLNADDIALIVDGILNAVIEGPDQWDGGGEALPPGGDPDDYNITVAQALREIVAYAANSWTGGDGPTVVMKSRVGGINRLVATLANGNRTVTSRDHD